MRPYCQDHVGSKSVGLWSVSRARGTTRDVHLHGRLHSRARRSSLAEARSRSEPSRAPPQPPESNEPRASRLSMTRVSGGRNELQVLHTDCGRTVHGTYSFAKRMTTEHLDSNPGVASMCIHPVLACELSRDGQQHQSPFSSNHHLISKQSSWQHPSRNRSSSSPPSSAHTTFLSAPSNSTRSRAQTQCHPHLLQDGALVPNRTLQRRSLHPRKTRSSSLFC